MRWCAVPAGGAAELCTGAGGPGVSSGPALTALLRAVLAMDRAVGRVLGRPAAAAAWKLPASRGGGARCSSACRATKGLEEAWMVQHVEGLW